MNELPHERIAQKMYELGGTWTPSRYTLLAKEMGIEASLAEVMLLCAPKYGYLEQGVGTNVWKIPARR